MVWHLDQMENKGVKVERSEEIYFLVLLGCDNLRNLEGFSQLMVEPEPAGFGDHQPH